MTIKIMDAGTLREITSLRIKQAGVLRRIRSIKIMDQGTLRTVAIFSDPISVSVPESVGGAAFGETVTTGTASATVSGGTGPYTYLWTLENNGGGNASIASAGGMASTTFTKSAVPEGTTVTDLWRVTVTDSFGETATATLNANFTHLTRT